MSEQGNWKYNARKGLIESIMKEIDVSKDPNEVYLDVFYAISSCGLHMKAQKVGLFNKEEWQKRENLPHLIKSIETFLWKEIR